MLTFHARLNELRGRRSAFRMGWPWRLSQLVSSKPLHNAKAAIAQAFFDCPLHALDAHFSQRLRQRLLDGGAEALADYELLEFLLFAAIRQGDTKPLAKALIAHFGSFAAVLTADPQALRQVKGMGDASVAALHANALAARRMARGFETLRRALFG